MKIHKRKDGTLWAGFEVEAWAEKFAEKMHGTVKFSPLPDYMRMIPYWIVEWK